MRARVMESEVKYPTFPKFPTPTSQHKGNEICLKINGNRGTQQEISVSTKVSKEIVPFQQEFPI